MWQHRLHTVSKRERERGRDRERERERQRRQRQRPQRRQRQRLQRQRPTERAEGERRERERRGGRTCARRLSRLRRVYARAVSPLLEKDAPETVSPLLEKDATGTPEVPVPVLHREGLFGPPPTEDVDGAHLARTNSRTLHSARIVHSFTVPCSLTALAALADRSFFNCYGLVVKLTA